jgi:hypothetical protein
MSTSTKAPNSLSTLSKMHMQHLHYCDPIMAPTLTILRMFNHNQHILVMLNYQIQWTRKIQTPLIPKPHDGQWL